jgi:hypothetical protein
LIWPQIHSHASGMGPQQEAATRTITSAMSVAKDVSMIRLPPCRRSGTLA